MSDLDIPPFPHIPTVNPRIYQAVEQALQVLEIDQSMLARLINDHSDYPTDAKGAVENYQIAKAAYHVNARAINALIRILGTLR